jgi:RNA polymerase sigma-70 factor (ECF subfamily)
MTTAVLCPAIAHLSGGKAAPEMLRSPVRPATSPSFVEERVPESADRQGLSRADEDTLLESVRLRRPEAMAEIYDRFSSVVYSVALRILREPAAAEDVMQEVFIQLWRKPDAYVSHRGSLCAWLAVVARNRSIDTLRRRRPEDSTEDVVLSSPVNYADLAERECMMDKVHKAMLALPEEQRHMVELAFFQGQTHTEIAEATGDPLGTVKTRIRSALLSLRKALEP